MTVGELYKKGLSVLKDRIASDEAVFECDCLFERFAGHNRVKRITDSDLRIDSALEKRFLEAVGRRTDGEPLQYILGEWEFMGNRFLVGEGVLIPRPETEMLVEYVSGKLKKRDDPVIYDLCAGSGAIGVSVAKLFPECKVYLFEKFERAYNYLVRNVGLNETGNATAVRYDIFDGCSEAYPKPDIILSNPPYIKTDEIPSLQSEVSFEPDSALDGGDDGLDFYRCISEKWFPYINDGGFLAVECGDGQSADIIRIFDGKASDSLVLFDFNNIDRAVVLNV